MSWFWSWLHPQHNYCSVPGFSWQPLGTLLPGPWGQTTCKHPVKSRQSNWRFQSITYLFWSPLFASWPHCPRWTPSGSSSAASGWSSASSPCPAPPCCPASSPPPPPPLGSVCSGGCYQRLVSASGWQLWIPSCVETCCCCSLLPAVNLGTTFLVFGRNELMKICYYVMADRLIKNEQGRHDQ